jgi:ABC-type phosphate/phosphonate transport system substrate-binding protein
MKRMRILLLAGGLLSGLFASAPARAYFLDAAYGVRPAGMGEAFVAVADDANTALYNPAGFSTINHIELLGMYSDLYANLNAPLYTGQKDGTGYNFISAAVPLGAGIGVCGVSWLQFYSTLYQENTIMLSYGHRLWTLAGNKITLDAGVNLKALRWSVADNAFTTDPANFPADHSRSGLTGDVGLLVGLGDGFRLGLDVDNVRSLDLGLTMPEVIARVYRAGLAYRTALDLGPWDAILASVEMDGRNDQSNNLYDPKLGLEGRFFNDRFALRLGVNAEAFTSGLSYCQLWQGAPWEFQVDYAFTCPFYIRDSWGSHRMGLTFRWKGASPNTISLLPARSSIPPMFPGPLPQKPAENKPIVIPVALTETSVPVVIEPDIKPMPLPEQDQNKIVIGVETVLYADYGNPQAVQAVMGALEKYLRKTTGVNFEWKDYSLDEMTYALHSGEVDAVISYSSYFNDLARQGLLKPTLTIQSKGRDKQRCCLIVRGDSPITKIGELKGKRLGFLDPDTIPRLKSYFFRDVSDFKNPTYFGKIEKHKNAIDSLMALQMDTVDAIAAFEYILPICQRMNIEIPNGVRVIARSELVPNLPVYIRPSASKLKMRKIHELGLALLKFHEEPDAKPFFDFFDFDRFVLWDKANSKQK